MSDQELKKIAEDANESASEVQEASGAAEAAAAESTAEESTSEAEAEEMGNFSSELASENEEDFSDPEEIIPEGETRASYTLKKFIATEGDRKTAYQQNKEELLDHMKKIIEQEHRQEESEEV